MTAPANFNAVWAAAIARELAHAGVRDVVVAPGSRSAPLALAFGAEPSLRTHVVLDERSAAFVALGAAKASGVPAAVLATSGSAGAHFFPAALEASAAGVPMVMITADRPPELHGFGAPQTVSQQHLFGDHVRAFADPGAPIASEPALRHLRALVARTAALARSPRRGPVHLNAPFREPLAPVPETIAAGLQGATAAPAFESAAPGAPSPDDLARVAAALRARPRGVIVCGPRDAVDGLSPAVEALRRATGYALLAEAASNVRAGGSGAVATYDALLRHPPVAAALRPDAVVRLGGGLTSKVLQEWLDRAGAFTVHLSENGLLFDPAHAASVVVPGDAAITCAALAAAMGPRGTVAGGPLSVAFEAADALARSALEAAFAAAGDERITEPRLAREVAAMLPAGTQLVVSSSMPVRDLDAFAGPLKARVLSNRGLNGIDGIVSTAAGAALATGARTVALLGDVALLHDVGGLVTAKLLRVPLTIVVPNNDGGGIFHFLPIASHAPPDAFERFFGTPHGSDLAAAAALGGARLHRPQTVAELRGALREAAGDGLHVVEVRTDRASNAGDHRALQQRVADAVGEGPWT